MEKQNLADRLKDVIVGDILKLQTENGDEVVGFVTKMQRYQIKLSRESPNNKFMSTYGTYEASFALTKGDRWYDLNDFSDYEIIRSVKR